MVTHRNRKIGIYGPALFLTACILTFHACKKSATDSDTNGYITGPITFERSPVAYDRIARTTPLGNLNPPGHTFPTDHIYFYLRNLGLSLVVAHAPGTITSLYYHEWSNDFKITFKHTETFYSYLDHVRSLTPIVEVGATIEAGDTLGYGDPFVSAVDLGVIDYDTTRYFITPERYHDGTNHCGNPYLYFTDSVRNELLALNPRTAEPRGGKIDFDIDGALSGNWFLEGTPVQHSAGFDYQEYHLAFVYDMYDPAQIRIAAGGTLDMAPFVYSVKNNTPDPGDVTMADSVVTYELLTYPTTTLLVQLVETRKIKVEVFPNTSASEFTNNAKIYER